MGLFDFLRRREGGGSAAGAQAESSHARSDASDSFSPDSGAGSAQQSCPLQRSIRGRFASQTVKCGSPVGLLADSTNITDGTTATFQLRAPAGSGNTVVATETAPLRGSQVRGLQWVSKRAEPASSPEMDFGVSAGGASNDSDNGLSFHDYPNQARETKTARMSSGRYGWDKKFTIEFQNGWIIVVVKIKLQNMQGPRPAEGAAQPAVGSPVTTRLKDQYTRSIVGYLSNKFLFHRHNCRRGNRCDCPNARKCCKFRVQVRVQFVESGEHHVVRLYTGSGRANSAEWFRVKTWAHEDAHETGHLLGWYDEYSGGATGSAPWHVHDNVIMSTGATMEPYYYQEFKDWFAAKMNEPWDPIRT